MGKKQEKKEKVPSGSDEVERLEGLLGRFYAVEIYNSRILDYNINALLSQAPYFPSTIENCGGESVV